MNHFPVGCYFCNQNSHKNNSNNESNKKAMVNEVYCEPLYVRSIFTSKSNRSQWSQEILLNNSLNVTFKLDTGADCSILNYAFFKKLNIPLSYHRDILDYNDNEITTIGECEIACTAPHINNVKIKFVICKNRCSILGAEAC
jgi:hypothetical protein